MIHDDSERKKGVHRLAVAMGAWTMVEALKKGADVSLLIFANFLWISRIRQSRLRRSCSCLGDCTPRKEKEEEISRCQMMPIKIIKLQPLSTSFPWFGPLDDAGDAGSKLDGRLEGPLNWLVLTQDAISTASSSCSTPYFFISFFERFFLGWRR